MVCFVSREQLLTWARERNSKGVIVDWLWHADVHQQELQVLCYKAQPGLTVSSWTATSTTAVAASAAAAATAFAKI